MAARAAIVAPRLRPETTTPFEQSASGRAQAFVSAVSGPVPKMQRACPSTPKRLTLSSEVKRGAMATKPSRAASSATMRHSVEKSPL